jgi:hypothetical protein
MKGKRFFLAFTLATSLAILPSAIAGEKTSSKAAGPSPTTVVNTILSGAGVPAKTLGINGDFYIDTKNLNLYGPKASGVWKVSTSLRSRDVPVVANIIGETGAMGQTGSKGATGDKGATGATGPQGIPGVQGLTGVQGLIGMIGLTGLTGATGPQGLQGLMGVIGATGLTGAAGTNGLTGVAGAKGDTGSQGIQGIKGDTGTQGIQGTKGDAGATGGKGDIGTTGAKGDVGAKGDIGTKGDAGAPGAQGDPGISVSKFVTVPQITVPTGADGSKSSSVFFIADSSGNYTFDVLLSGLVGIDDLMKLYAEIVIGDMAIGNQFTVASDSVSGVNRIIGRQYGFRIIGSAANVDSGTSFSVRVGIVYAAGSTEIKFVGKALVNKVGSIG